MEAQVIAALAANDYAQTSQLLKQWHKTEPTSPLLRLYAAQLQERTQHLDTAEQNYTKLLKQTTNAKLITQARAGIARIQQQRKAQKQAALEQANQAPDAQAIALLAIATPPPERRSQAIAGLAKVFNLDPYTARLKVPNNSFRLHRIGPWGDIRYYANALSQEKVPTLIAKVNQIKALNILQVCYFESLTPQPSVICKNAEGELKKISFDWADIQQQINGQLPIFEQVIDIGNWGKLVHKEKVQDYVQVIDFHLPKRKMILRLCDRNYQYLKGVSLGLTQKPAPAAKGKSSPVELNSRIQWNALIAQFQQTIQANTEEEFTRFGTDALERLSLLPPIPEHLDIERRAPSGWDLAFHLYSAMAYLARFSGRAKSQ
jgi:hypothetical protein